MRKFVSGIAIGVAIGTTATATASTAAYKYLNRGDTAVAVGGETACRALPHRSSRNGFVCRVGGDYRAKFGVLINEREAAITQYTGFNSYRMIFRKRQSALAP